MRYFSIILGVILVLSLPCPAQAQIIESNCPDIYAKVLEHYLNSDGHEFWKSEYDGKLYALFLYLECSSSSLPPKLANDSLIYLNDDSAFRNFKKGHGVRVYGIQAIEDGNFLVYVEECFFRKRGKLKTKSFTGQEVKFTYDCGEKAYKIINLYSTPPTDSNNSLPHR